MNYDPGKYKIWTWKNPMMLHWIINPGVAINELILGQRVPKVTLIEKNSPEPLGEKTFVPCPHCQHLHIATKWNVKNKTAFGNWFGLYCDQCDRIIPCLINITSFILLIITAPVWYWFKDSLKKSWLEKQKEKFSKPLDLKQPEFKWWKIGLGFGISMFVIMSLFEFLIDRQEFSWLKIIVSFVVWIAGGFLFGLWIKRFAGKKKNVNTSPTNQSVN